MSWVSQIDIEERWGSSVELPHFSVVAARIHDAELLVRYEFPTIDARIGEGDDVDEVLLGNVRFVVAQMVLRVLRNPDAIRSRTEQTGPFSGTATYGGDDPGSPWMTDAERNMLSGLPGAPHAKAFVIDPTATQTAAASLGGGLDLLGSSVDP